jgi:4-amino-4-deoxy-L-arabinose transferase-like glycosyltransferase
VTPSNQNCHVENVTYKQPAVQKIRQYPILILLIVNLLVGIFTFRNYGLSWDEPLFYDYANALGYAYSPQEWFSGNFNLENAYGSSGTDHANRGPAYIILAHPIVSVIELLGVDNASAWHLINFLTFQLGVYLLYRLAKRWMSNPAALASAALFAWQPLLWGHAFINPKDPPFLVFFLGAVCFGFEMVDQESKSFPSSRTSWKLLGSAAFFLGIATSIRVLGPLAGALVGIYALGKLKTPALIKRFAIYAALTILVAFITWPYLWTNPIQKFIEAFGFMSDNPTQLEVLFYGQIYRAYELPRRYLPVLLSLTLTEPVLPLFLIGLLAAFWKKNTFKQTDNWSLFTDYFLLLFWFLIPFAYVILRKPPMYDGYRHFLFMLPPLFIFAGFAFEKLFETIKTRWTVGALTIILLAPGIYGSIQLHPYEYTYYNSFTGGTSGAFRTYETDFWLTCYKEAVEQFDEPGAQLFIKREPYIAAYYANKNITIRDYRTEFGKIQSGDFVLVNTRANEDIKAFKDAPIVLQIRRGHAVFCEIKKIP